MSAYVPIDLHRHRSVVMNMAADGEVLGWVRLANDPEALVAEVLKCGEAAEVAIEATYGWYWAVDALQAAGANVHLVAPSRLTAFEGRRVKNDQKDCQVLGDLMRANMLPHAWISTPQVRQWRELVRYRAKLVGFRTSLKAQTHAVIAKHGLHVPVSDLFGPGGRQLLAHWLETDRWFHSAFGQRIESSLVLIDAVAHEIDELETSIRHQFRDHAGYHAIQQLPGVGPVIGAILVAEIGDVTRFQSPAHLASWCGLTPRHRESDTTIKRGPITKQGSKLVRWAAIEAAQKLGKDSWLREHRDRLAERRNSKSVAKVAAARKLITLVYYGMRDGEIRCLTRPEPAVA
jgi:transposase